MYFWLNSLIGQKNEHLVIDPNIFLVFWRGKLLIWVCNDMKASQWWQNLFYLWLNFRFNINPVLIVNPLQLIQKWKQCKDEEKCTRNIDSYSIQYSTVQEIRHTLFGQLLFPLAFLPYSTCCQELCSAVLYSFCKVLRKSKHPCCRLRLTRLVLTVSAVSFLLHPTVLSAEVRLVWLVKARCEETAEGGEKMEKVMKEEEEREGEGEIYSACQFVVLSDTRPTAFWWFVPCFTFLLRGCCSFLVWEAGAFVCVFVRLWTNGEPWVKRLVIFCDTCTMWFSNALRVTKSAKWKVA